ncbi:N-acetylmuramoyl-L-alanine amidase [Sphingorhabdus arenilitoris]|uniref:N-acetylmuramoyl-L-alanine amidase n=1 Tax=Sphingorhabdus arenilitoris TaxID=1490041 RepID=A0ABV8RDY0_9SPHN
MLLTALIASGLFTITPSLAGTVRQIAATDNAVTIYFDDVVNKASIFTLSGPDRIAVDIVGATTGGSANAGGPVAAVRQGQFDSDTARIVFDLGRPALITGGQFSDDGRSLHLNLRQAAFGEFVSTLGRGRTDIIPPLNFRASPPKKQYEVTAPIGSGRDSKNLPKIHGPADDSLPLVVIDAGHGGHDPGAISPHNGKREKDITLAIAKSIREELVKSGRVRVALTRDNDRFIILQDRFGIARKMGANLFISIHADAAENPEANGATVYTLSETASDREAQKLAARENKANIINGVNLGGADSNVSSILIDLTQRETMNVSADFAKLLLREAKPNITLRSNSHKFASFVVLKAPDTPSILFETGYISNESDGAFLASAAGQQKIGRSVASAVQVHFARRLARR